MRQWRNSADGVGPTVAARDGSVRSSELYRHASRATRRLRSLAWAIGLLHGLSGCILTADKSDPALDLPASYREAHGRPSAAPPKLQWWRGFRSPELTSLMEEAQVANLD